MDSKNFGSCVYYPCEKNRRLGVSACIGCSKFQKRNPAPKNDEDG